MVDKNLIVALEDYFLSYFLLSRTTKNDLKKSFYKGTKFRTMLEFFLRKYFLNSNKNDYIPNKFFPF
jgi:hypothetical protein